MAYGVCISELKGSHYPDNANRIAETPWCLYLLHYNSGKPPEIVSYHKDYKSARKAYLAKAKERDSQ